MDTLISVLLYFIQIILPFLGVLIIYYCYKSLFGGISPERPLIALVNCMTGEKIPITYWENSIGRDRHCDVVVDSPTASRDHAVLFRRDEGWIVADTNSKGGIFLNGKKVEESAKVELNDVIQIGGIDFELNKSEILPEKNRFINMFKSHNICYPAHTMLFLVNFFQLLSFIEVSFSSGKFDIKPMIVFVSLIACSWTLLFITTFLFKRINFEIEALGIFFSGIGIASLCGVDVDKAYVQLVAFSIGMVFFEFIILFLKNPDIAMKCRPYVACFAIILLLVNLVFGKVKNGSQNWIVVGPFSIQPSEFVKVAFIFFGTSTLRGIQTAKNLTGFILFSTICMGALFAMGDFGTACIFFVTFVLISFMRSGSIRTVFLTCSAAVLGLFLILKFKPYIVTRFSAWRHVWEHVNDIGYQQTRVLTYASSGGLIGLGIGKGCLKYVFAAPSDLVFGMLCEEWGLVMSIALLIGIAFLGIYARRVSARSRSAFYAIASCCSAGMIIFQMMMNVFGVIDIFPLTGVTLPFISLGGSSMISAWGLLAFIKVSDERTYGLKR